jgi:hypothetical protein
MLFAPGLVKFEVIAGELMRTRALCSLFCLMFGFLLAALGAFVLLAQYLEWRSFGNWNAVSLRYALAYFDVQRLLLISPASRVWDLPLSAVLMGLGGAVATVGAFCRQRSSRPGVMHSP